MARIDRKFGINVDCLRKSGISTCDTLVLAHQAGFRAFFNNFSYGDADNVAELKELADRLGMDYEFIHAPFRGINAMWEEGDGYAEIYNAMITTVDAASANGVPAVIIHVSSGWQAPPVGDLGLSRYDALVDYAAEKGVTLAFENLRMVGNLAYLTDRYAGRDNVRFCLDVGHEHCYTKTVTWMDIFTDRLFCTHIHDNNGRSGDKCAFTDTHLLPFDGSYDFGEMKASLERIGYGGALMLEVSKDNKYFDYKKLSDEEYLRKSYDSLMRISLL